MAVQFTWSGILDSARRDAGITTPTTTDTAQAALAAMSQAQHELQQISNAVHRKLSVPVSVILSADGSYPYDYDVKLPLTWQFTPTGATTPLDVRPITFDAMDLQKRLGNQMGPVQSIVGLDLTVALYGDLFFLYPYQSMQGTVTLKYIANLWPYDTTNPVGDWSAFGANPTATMKTTGPAREFATSVTGIKDYLVMKLMEDRPDLLQRMPTRYKRAEANWLQAKQYAVRDQPQMNSRQLFRPRNGVVQ
jgi:hypothetical protein